MNVNLNQLVAVDTESKGGGTFGDLEVLWSIAKYDENGGTCLWCDWIPGNDYQQEWDNFLGGKIPVFHNAAHDVSVLRELGIDVGPYLCSMIMGYNLNPNMKMIHVRGMKPTRYGIEAWGQRVGLSKLEHPPWDTWEYSPTFKEELPPYNIRDAEIVWRMMVELDVLGKLQRDKEAWDYYINVDLPFIEIIIELNSVGMLVDLEKMEEWEQELLPVQEKLLRQLNEMVKDVLPFTGTSTWHKKKHEREDGFYTGEFDEVKGYRFIFYRHEFIPTNAAHIKQACKKLYDVELENVQGDYLTERFGDLPIVPLLNEYRELDKLLGTYCKPFREKRSEDGYVRASWKQMLITGRISSQDPSLQVLPARDALGATFRKFIVPPVGYKMVRVDFSNIEIRTMTAFQALYFMERKGYIPDDIQKIVEVFWNDPEAPEGDFHGTMTTIWFGLQPDHPDFKYYRNAIAKNITFARTYGAGINKLASQMKVDYATAKQRKLLADSTNPSFEEFKRWVVEEFEEGRGWEHTYFGRRLFYPTFMIDMEEDEEQTLPNGDIVSPNLKDWLYQKGCRQAFNAKAGQAPAADILKIICVTVAPYIWKLGARFCGLVHDELLFYVPDETVQEVMQVLYIAINRDDILPYVPVRGTPSYGDSWLEAKNTKEKVYVVK
jgi:DNA polymerase I-like protein with 3'-5' exonuclease and polymerase domains